MKNVELVGSEVYVATVGYLYRGDKTRGMEVYCLGVFVEEPSMKELKQLFVNDTKMEWKDMENMLLEDDDEDHLKDTLTSKEWEAHVDKTILEVAESTVETEMVYEIDCQKVKVQP